MFDYFFDKCLEKTFFLPNGLILFRDFPHRRDDLLRIDAQQATEPGTGFLDAGAAALPSGWPEDAVVGSGWPPAGREVGTQGKDVDDRDAGGGGQVAGAGVRADKNVHFFNRGGGFAQAATTGEIDDNGTTG